MRTFEIFLAGGITKKVDADYMRSHSDNNGRIFFYVKSTKWYKPDSCVGCADGRYVASVQSAEKTSAAAIAHELGVQL
jgi:hypothetical protein